MLYLGRRAAFILITCILAVQVGACVNNSRQAIQPGEAGNVLAEHAPYTDNNKTEETKTVCEEMETYTGVLETNVSEQGKLLADAGDTITDAQNLVNQHSGVQFENTVKTSEETLKEDIVLSDRGGHKLYAGMPQYNLSDRELNLIASVVQAEAGGEPYEGQIAVANVIFNRLKAGWGKTVTEVITQEGQFTPVRKEPSVSAKNAVREALYGRNTVPEGTLFFQNLELSTDFTIPCSKEYVAKIGMHSFYR